MFEVKTFEQIIEDCLERVPNSLDKRQGSIIYDAIAPCAVELAQMYATLYGIVQDVFISTATGDSLDALTEQYGVYRKPATKAIRLGLFSKEITIGSRFSIQDATFVTISQMEPTDTEPYRYRLQCEQAGSIGNQYYGTLTPITQIPNLTRAVLADILLIGDDEETDEDLRERYKEEIVSPAFGGNIAYYKEVTKGLEGVGGCKVLPIWNGGGTVKLIITGYTTETVPQTLIDEVQQAIDPTPQQTGMGLAPIGHLVTVEGVFVGETTVYATVTITNSELQEIVKQDMKNAINAYFGELLAEWDSTDKLIIRSAQLTTRMLAVDNVIDVADVSFKFDVENVTSGNLELESNQVPSLLDIDVTWG